jgi:hypothetical protein
MLDKEVPKLWIFGDSFSESYNELWSWAKEYIEWKGYKPKVYGEILAEKFSYKLVNKSIGGCDNYTIFEEFCKSSHLIGKNDSVIFGWTQTLRFRVVANSRIPGDREYWYTIRTVDDMVKVNTDLTPEIRDVMLVERSKSKYVDEVNSWIHLINTFLSSNTVIHWNFSTAKMKGIFVHPKTIEKIGYETNDKIKDGHYSEYGHVQLSKILSNSLERPVI